MDGQEPGDLPIYKSTNDNLDLVPARISLAKLESKLVGDFDAPFRLKDRIEPLKKIISVKPAYCAGEQTNAERRQYLHVF